MLDLHIKQLSLISLTPTNALVVVVAEDGQVFNRHMDFAEEVSSDELARVQHLLNEVFGGNTLHDIGARIQGRGMSEAFADPLVRMTLDEVLSCLREGEGSRAHSLGFSSLLSQPEFSQSEAVLPVMQVLEDDTDVACTSLTTRHVKPMASPRCAWAGRIGPPDLSGVSVVASRYGRGDSAGVVAVIGPTRMDYSKVLRAVPASRAPRSVIC